MEMENKAKSTRPSKNVLVRDLSGPVLDCFAAIAFGLPREEVRLCKGGIYCEVYLPKEERGENMGILTDAFIPGTFRVYQPTQWWSNTGPLIDLEDICFGYKKDPVSGTVRHYAYTLDAPRSGQYGDTTLEAVTRCFVAAKLGKRIPREWMPKVNGA